MFNPNRGDYADIDGDILSALIEYGRDHKPVGGFLRAVLSNDLAAACAKADAANGRNLVSILMFVYNELPADCWGSPARMSRWLSYTPQGERR